MNITTIGLDLAKSVFHVVCFNKQFKEVKKRMLRRNQVLQFFTQLPPCLVAMEACASSHYWGRELRALGHDVKLIPPQHVKPYLRGNKNDYNDARAIAEASTRPSMPFVAIKTTEEQDMQAIHRMRAQCIRDRTALSNSTRGLLSEYGQMSQYQSSNFRIFASARIVQQSPRVHLFRTDQQGQREAISLSVTNKLFDGMKTCVCRQRLNMQH
jgi:transposase